MSAGTRKKLVNFHKLLSEGIKDDYQEETQNNSDKRTEHKKKSKNDFLGKKRGEVTPTGDSNNSNENDRRKQKKRENDRNRYKKNKLSKIKKPTTNENIHSSHKFHSSKQGQARAPENKSPSKKLKVIRKVNSHINKEDYYKVLNENVTEYKRLGIVVNSDFLSSSNSENKLSFLNSDLSSLYLNLFSMTKFENSKPYKMIDYILNNDNNYLISKTDKEQLEEMKKTVYNKPIECVDDQRAVFKALYQYFKLDFSSSYLFKVFDKLNKLIQENFWNLPANSNAHLNDKKDKFTYQSYLTEKLKTNCYDDIINELNDKELWKSVIYICNKTLKNNKKDFAGIKSEPSTIEFIQLIKNNIDFIDEKGFKSLYSEGTKTKSKVFKELEQLSMLNKNELGKVKHKIKRMLPLQPNQNCKYKENATKLLDFFLREKEDDWEKICKKMEKYDKQNDEDGIRSFYILFKLFFYLKTLSGEDSHYIYDHSLWQNIQSYLDEYYQPTAKESKISTGIKLSNSSRKRREKKDELEVNPVLQNFTILSNPLKEEEKIEKQTNNSINAFNSINNSSHTNNAIINSNKKNKFEKMSISNVKEEKPFTYEDFERELYTRLITRLTNKENIFEVIKPIKKNTTKNKKEENNLIENTLEQDNNLLDVAPELNINSFPFNSLAKDYNEDDKMKCDDDLESEGMIVKPISVRAPPGGLPTINNKIVINNFYNIYNQSSVPICDSTTAFNLVNNLQLKPNLSEQENKIVIINNIEDESGKSILFFNFQRKKEDPKKQKKQMKMKLSLFR